MIDIDKYVDEQFTDELLNKCSNELRNRLLRGLIKAYVKLMFSIIESREFKQTPNQDNFAKQFRYFGYEKQD